MLFWPLALLPALQQVSSWEFRTAFPAAPMLLTWVVWGFNAPIAGIFFASEARHQRANDQISLSCPQKWTKRSKNDRFAADWIVIGSLRVSLKCKAWGGPSAVQVVRPGDDNSLDLTTRWENEATGAMGVEWCFPAPWISWAIKVQHSAQLCLEMNVPTQFGCPPWHLMTLVKLSRLLAAAVSAAVVQSFLPARCPEAMHRNADLGVTSESTSAWPHGHMATWPKSHFD